MSHPTVTCCLSSTANPGHALENVGVLRGPLPDAATRDRMLRHLERLPGYIRRGQASLRASG